MSSQASSVIVLRRKSWLIVSWAVIVGLGFMALFAVRAVSAEQGFRVGWQGVPVYLLIASAVGRVSSARVMLGHDMRIINPFRTYYIPAPMIQDVLLADDGTLQVAIKGEERKVSVSAFGGSLIDHAIGTSDMARKRIKEWLESNEREASVGSYVKRWTRCLIPDVLLALCVASVIFGVVFTFFSGA